MSLVLSLIGDIVASVQDISTVVTSFKMGYVDDTENVVAIVEDCSKMLQLLSLLRQSSSMKNASTVEFWEEFNREIEGTNFSLMEGFFSILYFVLISKEKYSVEIPVLCANLYVSILLLPSAYRHGLLRCSLYQVTVSAILRCVNNEELLLLSEPYRVVPVSLISQLISSFSVLDEMTIKFVWSELCMLIYECCLNPTMISSLSELLSHIISFAIKSETDIKMGELLRILLPIISLYQEGKKMDEKGIRNSQKIVLSVLTNKRLTRFQNTIYALIQRLIINTPDRVDDRRNTIDTLMTLLLSLDEQEKNRVNSWINSCSRCNAANVRLCVVALSRALLMSRYVTDTTQHVIMQSQEIDQSTSAILVDDILIENSAEKMESQEKSRIESDRYEEEASVLQRELFLDEKPFYSIFFDIILSRCSDIVISIRAEAAQSIGLLLDFINENVDAEFRCILDVTTCKKVLELITDRLTDSAVAVRKSALNAYAGCALNSSIRALMDDETTVSVISSLLQDQSVMVKRSALLLFYRLLEFTTSLQPLFFSISLSMFENTANTDIVIIKNCQTFVFDNIIDWVENPSNLIGWRFLEFFNNANVPSLEAIMKLLIEKNTINSNRLMKSCIAAIEWINQDNIDISVEDDSRLQLPRLEENAWMLLMIIAKLYKRMDVDFIQKSIENLVESCSNSQQVSRDKFLVLTAISISSKFEDNFVKQLYISLVRQLLKLQMNLDMIHLYLRLYLCCLDHMYSDIIIIQKSVNLFVYKLEVKVDKILREFIFRSGVRLRSEPLPESQVMTQRRQSQDQTDSQEIDFSQSVNHVDGLREVMESDSMEFDEFSGDCSLLGDEVNLRWLFPWVFIVGELGLLGIEESEEGNLMSDKTVALLQSLTTYSLPMVKAMQASVNIPSSIS